MTVEELIEKLQTMDQKMEICFDDVEQGPTEIRNVEVYPYNGIEVVVIGCWDDT